MQAEKTKNKNTIIKRFKNKALNVFNECHYLAEQCHGTGAPPWSYFSVDPGIGGKTPTGT